jgi:hypothetical protein
MPVRKTGLACCRRPHGLKAVAPEQGQIVRTRHTAGTVLAVRIFMERNWRRGAAGLVAELGDRGEP